MPALLLLLTVWFLAPELTRLLHGPHPAVVQYAADGFFGAALAVLARRRHPSLMWRLLCDMSAVLWLAHPACLPGWSEGQSAGSICDAASGTPATGIICMLLVGIAGYLYDRSDRSARPNG